MRTQWMRYMPVLVLALVFAWFWWFWVKPDPVIPPPWLLW